MQSLLRRSPLVSRGHPEQRREQEVLLVKEARPREDCSAKPLCACEESKSDHTITTDIPALPDTAPFTGIFISVLSFTVTHTFTYRRMLVLHAI